MLLKQRKQDKFTVDCLYYLWTFFNKGPGEPKGAATSGDIATSKILIGSTIGLKHLTTKPQPPEYYGCASIQCSKSAHFKGIDVITLHKVLKSQFTRS